jgi:hypothetical protein
MAFIHGKSTEVWVNGVDRSTYFRNADFSTDVDTADSTTFKSSWRSHVVGQAGSTYELEGLYDPTMATVKNLLPTTAAVVTVGPGGMTAINDVARLVSARSTTYAESAPVGDVVAFSWAVMADGVVGLGRVLHPLGEDTNTTTGATKTDAAATTSGWTAHLHVTLVDGGSWVIKLQDSSASNFSDGADVTGGAFTAATGVTSQRLVSASGATLRRYVRYVATRTGGSVGHGITFGLAYSRNR